VSNLKGIIAVLLVVLPIGLSFGNTDDIVDLSAYYGFEEIEIIKLNFGVSNLNIVDLNNDGLNDLVIANNRKSKIEILIQNSKENEINNTHSTGIKTDINELAETSSFSREELLVTVKMANLVTGDLNGDGLTDLAFYGEPKGLYYVLGKSEPDKDKRSLKWHRREKIKISDGLLRTNSLICDDINGDKRDDLLLAGRDSIYVISQSETGQLGEPLKLATTSQPLAIKTGDLNGDGRRDLVLITDDNERCLHVRFGLSSGQLSPQMRFSIEKPASIELINYNRTNGDEVLVIEQASGRLSSYGLTKTTEQIKDDFPILSYPLEVSNENRKRDLEVGDFDGDGLIDVVISSPDSAEISLYRQVSDSGLQEPIRFPAFSDISHLDSMDIDRDGKSELGVLSIKEKAIGISRFEKERLSFPKPLDIEGEPVGMGFGDLDGNKRTDCAYIVRGSDDVRSFCVQYDIGSGKRKRVSTPLILEKLLANPDGLMVLDADQDGLNDVLVLQEYEDPIFIRQVSSGNFKVLDSPKSQAGLIKSAKMRSVTTTDIDEDGHEELLIAQRNFARSLVLSDGKTWNVVDQYNAKNRDDDILTLGAFDIDGNGTLEILLLEGKKGFLQILKASADGTYRFDQQLEVDGWNSTKNLKILFASLNSEENNSIILFDGDKFSVITPPSLSGSSPFAYDTQRLFSYETKIKNGRYGRLTAGDINSDNSDDIVMVEYKKNHIEILALDEGKGVLKPTSAMRFKVFEEKSYEQGSSRATIEPREIQICDVTGDGAEDLVAVIHDRIIIYPQDI
jgi:hypothetical protein